ncbi:MAG TPA: DUF922 domain-containing protein [Moraxellaceae bacterium]
MKRLFVFLLVAGLAWWWLGPRHRAVTLEQLATLPPPTTQSGPGHSLQVIIPDADMEYYTVSGGSVAEIRDSLYAQQPVRGFDGHTAWQVSWNWPGYGRPDCDLRSARLETRVKVTLPVWQPPAQADPALVLQWNNYAGNLALHEQGHVQRARQGFAKMQQILHDSTCADADAKLNVVLGEMRAADAQYDADTKHGTTQGAKFP